MDRIQAQQYIGKYILINEGQEGQYVGILNDIIAPPRKVWRGEVIIRAIAQLPTFQEDGIDPLLPPLKYIENETIECPGSKLFPLDSPEQFEGISFQDSLSIAVKRHLEEIEKSQDLLKAKKKVLTRFLSDNGIKTNEKKEADEQVIDYLFFKRDGRYLLVDESGEQLDLQDCPFEFIWKEGNDTFYGHYEGNGTFVTHEGIRFKPDEGTKFSMSQKQFDPYFILQNELEPEALLSLEHNLQKFGLTHEHLVDCQNTLLGQFLTAKGEKTFKGVNFLTYRNHRGVVLVQHHYERKLHDIGNDEIYDRFEFTSSRGERSIATFTNEFSNDK